MLKTNQFLLKFLQMIFLRWKNAEIISKWGKNAFVKIQFVIQEKSTHRLIEKLTKKIM